jgi:hypothetical protein
VHSRIDRSKCLFHCPSGGPRGLGARDNLHVVFISISVIEGIVGADRSTLILQEFISLKRKSLGMATSTSNKMYMLSNSQVAVCRSGTPPRPMSSPRPLDRAGSNAACVPSWDGGQRVASGADEAVWKHSQFGVALNRNALFSTSAEVGSGKASRHPSTASSSRVRYRHVHSSSAFDYPQVSSSSPAGHSNVPSSTTVRYMQQQHSYTVPSSSTVGYCNVPSSSMVRYTEQQDSSGMPSSSSRGYSNYCSPSTVLYMQQQHSYTVLVLLQWGTAMYPVPLWCDIPSNSIPLECHVPLQVGTVRLQYCTCSNDNLHQCAPLWL